MQKGTGGRSNTAAAHTGKTELANSVDQMRLETEHDYYNSGVLLMDLERGRKEISPEQDILNALYGEKTLPLQDAIWNYDARNYSRYLLRTGRRWNEIYELNRSIIQDYNLIYIGQVFKLPKV